MKVISKTEFEIKSANQKTVFLTGNGLLSNLAELIGTDKFSSVILVSDKTTYGHYGKQVLNSLKNSGVKIVEIVLSDGENSKDLSLLPAIFSSLIDKRINRNSVVVALGGGVVTDVAGFISSVYLRGIGLVAVPTTLLAQIDASLGGKNGVNLKIGALTLKNMIGCIKQPQIVVSDLDVLRTLPEKELKSGLGEMLKYYIGWGRPHPGEMKMFLQNPAYSGLTTMITACQEIKMGIVASDPFEKKGIRQKLNLGHTIGHAVESAAKGRLSHGESVTIGLAAAAKISDKMGILGGGECEKIIKTIMELSLPVNARNVDIKDVKNALISDKKSGTFVLIEKIGSLKTGIKVGKSIINEVLEEIII